MYQIKPKVKYKDIYRIIIQQHAIPLSMRRLEDDQISFKIRTNLHYIISNYKDSAVSKLWISVFFIYHCLFAFDSNAPLNHSP